MKFSALAYFLLTAQEEYMYKRSEGEQLIMNVAWSKRDAKRNILIFWES